VGAGDERPFAGVPIAIKTEIATRGMPLTLGSELFGDFIPDQDSHTVARLRRAGFVIVGITSMPEVGMMPVTEPRRHGPTRNPWDLERTLGGSSGGSAAAVAAGMVPLAQGCDGGGSIRIPAACCGLVGLKASRNRISRGPAVGDSWLSTDGVFTRTVSETAELLDILGGYELGDANWAPDPAVPFAEAARREPGRLRIAVAITPPPVDVPVDPVCAAAVREAAELLASLGHEIVEVEPPWQSDGHIAPMFLAAFGASISLGVLFGGMVTGREPTRDLLEGITWDIWEKSQALGATQYLAAVAQLQGYARAIITWLDDYDLLLTPSLAQRPVPIGFYDTDKDMVEWGRTAEFVPYTAGANITGLPAINLPLFQGDDGLPTGVHLMAGPLREDLLLSVGAQLEAAAPWADRRAPLD
ncbi:MAG: amidase, partial [Solirubrobacteraceae bacterium]